MAITSFTDARISQGIATLYAGQAAVAQLVSEANETLVDQVNPAGSIVKDFLPLSDGATGTLTRNTPETASGTQNIVPVTFNMYEYGLGSDAVTFPWREFLTRAENPEAYQKVIESVANKAITAGDILGTIPLRDTIAAGTNATYVHPLGPDNGSTQWTSPTASKLVRYGTQAATRAARADITTADLITWPWIQSMKMELRTRHARPIAAQLGTPIYAVIAHGHILNDILTSLIATAVYPNLLDSSMRMRLAELGIGISLVGLFDGVLLIESDRMVYTAAGADGINVYPVAMVGADFLAHAGLAPSAMPQKPADGDLINVGPGACVIVQPSYGGVHSNRTGTAAWYSYQGFGIFDAKSYIRVECASTSAGRI